MRVYRVHCPNGRRSVDFDTRADADYFAEWGHACEAGHKIEVIDTLAETIDRAADIRYPVRIERIARAYHGNERIPWEQAHTKAVCRSLRGTLRRYHEERATVIHDHGNAWSGHVRAIDAHGQILDIREIEREIMYGGYSV